MTKLEAIDNFTLTRFKEIKNLQRVGKEIEGFIGNGDKFECNDELAEYLLGKNPLGKKVVKVIEVVPEAKIVEETKEEPKPEKKTIKAKNKKVM